MFQFYRCLLTKSTWYDGDVGNGGFGMRSSEMLKEFDSILEDMENSSHEQATQKIKRLRLIALCGTFKSEQFLDFVKTQKPKLKLYERVTTWTDPNNYTRKEVKAKLEDIESLLKKVHCRFAFMEVDGDHCWMVMSEDDCSYDDAPVTNYRYFGFRIDDAARS